MKKPLLRTVVLFVICNLSFVIGKAQWVSIPDSNFGTWLNVNIGCMQGNSTIGWQLDTICAEGVALVFCPEKNIRDLTGIQYFDNLQTLYCGYNQLTSLPALPNSLRILGCDSNQFSILPLLPNALTELYCARNQLSNLPALPNSLTFLSCDNNQLSSLPALPNSLNYLDCSFNQLSSLPALPNFLHRLTCQNNQLSNLPALPDSLFDLGCDNNQLSSLPALPNSITTIHCSWNQLTSLPLLPNSLTELYCGSNQLSILPELPDSLTYFLCSENPSLFCLPQLKKIQSFYFSNTGITCLPNYPQLNTYSYPALDTIPLCDSANTNSCAYCHPHFSIYPDTANAGVYYGYNDSYGSNLTSYLWEFGDGDTSDLQYPSHTYAQPGQYYLCLTVSSPDCTNTYCDSSFLVFKTEGGLMSQLIIRDNSITGISNTTTNSQPFTISPNPASIQLFIETNGTAVEQINIYNTTGSLVMAAGAAMVNGQLSIAHLTSGVYIADIKTKEGSTRKRWVKM